MTESGSCIVVINDEPCQLRLTSQILKKAGHTVVSYSNARLALNWMELHPEVDLILTDLNMPEMSGWSLCEALRSPRYRLLNHTPVLAISATFAGLEADRVRLELGVNDFLPLPYSVEQLRHKVNELLQGRIPKPRLKALLVGLSGESAEAEAFRTFQYEVEVCADVAEALEMKKRCPPQVLVVVGPATPAQCQALFHFDTPLVSIVWVHPTITADVALQASRQGVHCVAFDYRPEYLVSLCEQARQQGSLTKTRDLLEERTLQLIASEARYRILFQSIPDMVVLMDEGGRILSINEAGCMMLGILADQAVGKHICDLTADEQRSQVSEMLHQTLLYGYVQYESVIICPSGDVSLEIHQRKLLLDGESTIMAIARDTSERRQCQEAVKLSDIRYRILAENTYDWEFWLSPTGHFLFNSPACQRITGVPARDFEDDCYYILELVHPDDKEQFEKQWDMLEPDSLPKDFEFRIIRPDGEVRWISHVSQAVFDNNDNYLGARGSHRDITEKRKGEEERARLVAAVEQVNESILITDIEAHTVYANQAYLESTGLTLAQVLGQVPQILCDQDGADSGELERDIRKCLRESRNWGGPYRRRHASTGSVIHVHATISLVRDRQGKASHYVWVERDITRERQLQAQLQQSQKMEAVGTLAGGIAHDFNNLLSGILGYAGLLRMHADSATEVLHSADVIERTARRAADLTQKLLGFARQGKNQNVALSLHQAIHDSLDLLNHMLHTSVQIKTEFCAGDPHVMGDPTQIQQILLNLAINARDAMDASNEKGVLTFRTRVITDPGGNDPLLMLEVCDTGPGIPLDIQSRIFDPFFTTKENGKGTGMGLAMVYGILKNHGGSIEVKSQPGEGTTFQITLPLVSSSGTRPAERPAPHIRGNGKILMVDDEELLRDVACRLLKHLGYQVDSACDGAEACNYYRSHYHEVDLVIIDMIMPNMSGGDCFRVLKQINPDVRAILSTGYSLNEKAQGLLDEGMVGFIQKPYQLSQLSEAISKAICAKPAANGTLAPK